MFFLEILCPAIGFVTFHTKWNLPHRMETSNRDTTTEERRSKGQEKLQTGELPSCSIESTGKKYCVTKSLGSWKQTNYCRTASTAFNQRYD